MAKTKFIRTRVDEQLKKNIDSLFSQLGISTTEAITMFFMQCQMHKGLPFEVKAIENQPRIYPDICPVDIKPFGEIPEIFKNPAVVDDFHVYTKEELNDRRGFF
ncbi:MAG: type II toxin-antitoxin system RelB/DinJ family antitoxin [Firmicutes bacterium]|nr:type II toxin-antitoxin system RelB/DinJ family antitoxin [Bacillota bacterium]